MLDRACAFAGEVTLVDKAVELTVVTKAPHLTLLTTLVTKLPLWLHARVPAQLK